MAMHLARQRIAQTKHIAARRKETADTPQAQLEEFISTRDFTGAVAFLDFYKKSSTPLPGYDLNAWLGYCSFHGGDYQKALEVYDEMLREEGADILCHLYAAVCLFYLGDLRGAEERAQKGPAVALQNRLLFHLSQKVNDDARLMDCHRKLADTVEDQLSLACMHYLRHNFQDAIDIYKRINADHGDFIALNLYIALAYYRLDYYDVSLEVLGAFLHRHPHSAVGINLKACNQFRLYNGKIASDELKQLVDLQALQHNADNSVVRHNLVVFRGGEGALQVLMPMVETIPEARLNLVIYYLRNGDVQEAEKLLENLEPVTPHEFILKAVVNAVVGQLTDSREHCRVAQHYFQIVGFLTTPDSLKLSAISNLGASAAECDTIPGRQCMASCLFLLKQFDDVLIYLRSVRTYFANDDVFLHNYGTALAAAGHFEEAEAVLLTVGNEQMRNEFSFLCWLARCHIMNNNPKKAWELYLKMDTSSSYNLLLLIGNDCYRVGSFFYAAKAFDVLQRIDPSPEDGKRGACIGVFQMVIAQKEPSDSLREIIPMLQSTEAPELKRQVETVVKVMRDWARDNHIRLS